MKIATFNINGILARHDALLAWLTETAPDVVCLQETKKLDAEFPRAAFEALGYQVELHGMKSFNGVAILSKLPLTEVTRRLPGDEADEHTRWIEATVQGRRPVRVTSLYLPNGNPAPGPKYDFKLAWMERMRLRVIELLKTEQPLVFCGDYNIIPQPQDAAKPEAWVKDALFLPASRAAFRRLTALGLTDALRARSQKPGLYTYWDFQAGAWERNNGIRIDHHLLSPQAADLLLDCQIDKAVRGREKPSDHVPIWIDLDA